MEESVKIELNESISNIKEFSGKLDNLRRSL